MIQKGQDVLLQRHNQLADGYLTLMGFRLEDMSPNHKQAGAWLRGTGPMKDGDAAAMLCRMYRYQTLQSLKIICPDKWDMEGFFRITNLDPAEAGEIEETFQIQLRADRAPLFQCRFSEPT